jgi:hypothetical protein
MEMQANCNHTATAFLISVVFMVTACQIIDTVNTRSENMNEGVGKYISQATLLNIVRAVAVEPLAFVALTGITGHDSLGTSLGLPTFTLGPGGGPREYAFGPNSWTSSFQNDFNVNVVVDPASNTALLTPVSPATIGFFINQDYPRDLLFFLFVDHIQVETGSQTNRFDRYDNRPHPLEMGMPPIGTDECAAMHDSRTPLIDFLCFEAYVASWLANGLTVEIDRSAIPTQTFVPAHRICFDRNLALQPDLASQKMKQISSSIGEQRCDAAGGWSPAETLNLPPDNSGSTTSSHAPSNKSVNSVPKSAWEFITSDGRRVEFATRSTYEVYRYLGRIIRLDTRTPLLFPNEYMDNQIIRVTHDTTNCFTQIYYISEHWCVPSDAGITKLTFQLLNQLVSLYTTPSTQPSTSTVRAIAP